MLVHKVGSNDDELFLLCVDGKYDLVFSWYNNGRYNSLEWNDMTLTRWAIENNFGKGLVPDMARFILEHFPQETIAVAVLETL